VLDSDVIGLQLLENLPIEPIPLIAGAVIALLVLFALVKILKTTFKTALLIAGILFALNFFGYGPGQLIEMIMGLVRPAVGG